MISVTESAASHISHMIAAREYGVGIRIGVKKTGCSGYAYLLEYCDSVTPEDAVFESNGVKIVVSPFSLPLLEGTTVDYVKKGLSEGFEFSNPQELGRCGCGQSFRY